MIKTILAFFIMLVIPGYALAWGASGHSIVAELAQRRLTKTAVANLEALLGNASLASVASWADDYKFTPAGTKTRRWHYVDIDLASDRYSEFSDCALQPEGDCLPKALDREITVLSDPTAPLISRQTALRLIVHLMGDLSQPFHCSEHAHDGGGNSVKVDFTGKGPDGKEFKFSGPLHALWDEGLISAHTYSWGVYLDEIEATTVPTISAKVMSERAIEDWTDACHQTGQEAYRLLPVGWEIAATANSPIPLGSDYQTRAQPLLDRQLAVGGLQLAAVLNQALSRNP